MPSRDLLSEQLAVMYVRNGHRLGDAGKGSAAMKYLAQAWRTGLRFIRTHTSHPAHSALTVQCWCAHGRQTPCACVASFVAEQARKRLDDAVRANDELAARIVLMEKRTVRTIRGQREEEAARAKLAVDQAVTRRLRLDTFERSFRLYLGGRCRPPLLPLQMAWEPFIPPLCRRPPCVLRCALSTGLCPDADGTAAARNIQAFLHEPSLVYFDDDAAAAGARKWQKRLERARQAIVNAPKLAEALPADAEANALKSSTLGHVLALWGLWRRQPRPPSLALFCFLAPILRSAL